MKEPGNSPNNRTAGRILALAVVSSLAVIALASILIYSVFFSADSSLRTRGPRVETPKGPSMTIAIARTAGGPAAWRTYARAIKRMSDATGRPMRVRYVVDRDEVVRLMSSREVDAGFLCTACYLELADEDGISLVATPRIAGKSKDAAVLVVKGSSPYRSLKDLDGRRVGVATPSSLAGYRYLYWLAKREGVDVAQSLIVVRGESQEQNVGALLAGDVDAVFVNRSQLALRDQSDLRIISQSPEYGMPPFVTGATVDTKTRNQMKQALLSMRPSVEQTRAVVEGFSEVTASDYDFARLLSQPISTYGNLR